MKRSSQNNLKVTKVTTFKETDPADPDYRDDEVWMCFMKFDTEKQGTMNTRCLKRAMTHLGEEVTDTQIYRMISDYDSQNTGGINLQSFKEIVATKRENDRGSCEADLLDAYVAMGGDEDGGGYIDSQMLIRTIKDEFEMTIDIEALIAEADEDGSGEIEFGEFRDLFGTSASTFDLMEDTCDSRSTFSNL